ncbi:hypothetical protein [Hydrotalea sandarakina]|jgi:hypothetical protein|uniref:Lipoprotein n=1 Tax=Hydrotalea sandarakina TaxID=1004304 RepID=A0A2W7S4N1_9BACT|nr:hypothetical protein [Hydrotalea sandarakina]PZX61929.1 hypothetical protein LX80_02093 [Hydrotalea sandarakina]
MKKNLALLFILFGSIIILVGCDNINYFKNNKADSISTQILPSPKKMAKKKKVSDLIGGTYIFGDNPEVGAVGSVIIYPNSDSTALFYMELSRGAPSYNSGELFGEIQLKDDFGIYDSRKYEPDLDCVLKFIFDLNKLVVISQNGHEDCGFGNAVVADHFYYRQNRSIPKYFIDGPGDTIQFKGLTLKKYLKRFSFN